MDAKRVLVVEDDVDMALLMQWMLETDGYAVDTADDGREALQVMRERSCDYCAVVLDLMLPYIDGVELLRLFREEDLCDGKKVVVVTGAFHLMKQVPVDEVFEVLTKPLTPLYLRETVKRLCDAGN